MEGQHNHEVRVGHTNRESGSRGGKGVSEQGWSSALIQRDRHRPRPHSISWSSGMHLREGARQVSRQAGG